MDVEPKAKIPDSDKPMTAPSITVNLWVPEREYEGLHALILWLQGWTDAMVGRANGTGRVPGHHELISFFRILTAAIHQAKKEKKDSLP